MVDYLTSALATLLVVADLLLLSALFLAIAHGVSEPSAVPIEPGKAIDLHRREWCLFLSNINQELEADIGAYAAHLMFHRAGIIDIEFVVDPISR